MIILVVRYGNCQTSHALSNQNILDSFNVCCNQLAQSRTVAAQAWAAGPGKGIHCATTPTLFDLAHYVDCNRISSKTTGEVGAMVRVGFRPTISSKRERQARPCGELVKRAKIFARSKGLITECQNISEICQRRMSETHLEPSTFGAF
jgi:hypothetical protein